MHPRDCLDPYGRDPLQVCCLDVSGLAYAQPVCDCNQQQETYRLPSKLMWTGTTSNLLTTHLQFDRILSAANTVSDSAVLRVFSVTGLRAWVARHLD
jgi:hypothetical protein